MTINRDNIYKVYKFNISLSRQNTVIKNIKKEGHTFEGLMLSCFCMIVSATVIRSLIVQRSSKCVDV